MNALPPFLLLLSLLPSSRPAPASVFAPYIAAANPHRASSPASALFRPRSPPAPIHRNLSEQHIRSAMLAPPHPAIHRSNPKPYAHGNTFIPTVNLNSPSHPAPNSPNNNTTVKHHPNFLTADLSPSPPHPPQHLIPAAPARTASPSHPKPSAKLPAITPGPSPSQISPASPPAREQLHPHIMSPVPAFISVSHHADLPPAPPAAQTHPVTSRSISLQVHRIPHILVANSPVALLVAAATLGGLAAGIARRYAACAAQPQRKARRL